MGIEGSAAKSLALGALRAMTAAEAVDPKVQAVTMIERTCIVGLKPKEEDGGSKVINVDDQADGIAIIDSINLRFWRCRDEGRC